MAPLLGVSPLEFRRDFLHQKTRVPTPRLSYGLICVILRLAVLVHCLFMTHKQTDGHTATAYTSVLGSIASRVNNVITLACCYFGLHQPSQPVFLIIFGRNVTEISGSQIMISHHITSHGEDGCRPQWPLYPRNNYLYTTLLLHK